MSSIRRPFSSYVMGITVAILGVHAFLNTTKAPALGDVTQSAMTTNPMEPDDASLTESSGLRLMRGAANDAVLRSNGVSVCGELVRTRSVIRHCEAAEDDGMPDEAEPIEPRFSDILAGWTGRRKLRGKLQVEAIADTGR